MAREIHPSSQRKNVSSTELEFGNIVPGVFTPVLAKHSKRASQARHSCRRSRSVRPPGTHACGRICSGQISKIQNLRIRFSTYSSLLAIFGTAFGSEVSSYLSRTRLRRPRGRSARTRQIHEVICHHDPELIYARTATRHEQNGEFTQSFSLPERFQLFRVSAR
jgi:hypothetical protein